VSTFVNNANPELLLSPFKIETWAGEKKCMKFFLEAKMLEDFGFTVPKTDFYFDNWVTLDPDNIEVMKQEAIKLGIEGWVVKDKPGGSLWKIKPEKTLDAFVVSYQVSDSDSYAGGLKSVTVAVLDEEGNEVIVGTSGTGFKADYRMSVDMDSLIGRVGEFGYQCLGARGKMKFPKFLRWRDDEKTREQCLISQIKEC
jgi:hypothetical protein